jgi:hypothetical protein
MKNNAASLQGCLSCSIRDVARPYWQAHSMSLRADWMSTPEPFHFLRMLKEIVGLFRG